VVQWWCKEQGTEVSLYLYHPVRGPRRAPKQQPCVATDAIPKTRKTSPHPKAELPDFAFRELGAQLPVRTTPYLPLNVQQLIPSLFQLNEFIRGSSSLF
jgi:hypothetical protein